MIAKWLAIDPVRQKADYSGKKRRHTRQHLATVDERLSQ